MFCSSFLFLTIPVRPIVSTSTEPIFANFFAARLYASAVYAVVLCQSVRLSQASIVTKPLNHNRITQTTPHDLRNGIYGILFSEICYIPRTLVFFAKGLSEIPPGSPPAVTPNAGEVF